MKLNFLMPSRKPVRGPKSARLKEWDAQDPDKIGSEGNVVQAEVDLATIEKLLEEHDREQQNGGKAKHGNQNKQYGKQVQELRDEAVQLRKTIRSARKALAQAEEKKQLDNIGIEHLADLVAAAQDHEGLLLGKERWLRRKRGDFLPP